MKSTNPGLEIELIKHRFGSTPQPLQYNGVQLAVPGGSVSIWPNGTVQVQGVPIPAVQHLLNVIAEAVGRIP